MADLIAEVEVMTPEQREGALVVLDLLLRRAHDSSPSRYSSTIYKSCGSPGESYAALVRSAAARWVKKSANALTTSTFTIRKFTSRLNEENIKVD